MNLLNEAASLLRQGDCFLILTHRRPDGDTIGSSAALCLGLRAMGKQAWILDNPEITPRYLPFWEGLTRPDRPEGAILISTDVSAPDMLLRGAEELAKSVRLCLDHHASNHGFAHCNVVRPDYAAAGELIYELLQELEIPLTPQMGLALYLAVSTDTGGFRYANVTGHTFQVAAACCAAGAEIFPLNRAFFTVKSPARIRVEAHLSDTIEYFASGKVGICSLSLADMAALGATEDDVDDLAGFARTIEGVKIGVMLRDQADGLGKISLRTDDDVNAAELCGMLGGGGHKAAAGANAPGGVPGARAAILRVLAQKGLLE
ncbi:MAG: DHH family phosphoesterase [Oscillospiraceae bacterium]|nr:DHH family phosphoesterase [Oscillospiraceae bacterium]